MGEDADWSEGLQDLADQVVNLTPIQWGYAAIVAAAAFLWIWVMGAPKPRPAVAGAAAVVVGAGVCLALALTAPHHLA